MLDTRFLGRRPGSMRMSHRVVKNPARIGLDLIGIDAGAEVELDLRLESVAEGVLVTGAISAETTGQCVRCLEPLTSSIVVHLTELFAYPNSITEATTDKEEVHRIVGDLIDLEQVVIDSAGLELPLSPTCTEDCPGLCAQCGVRLIDAGPDHGHDLIDPRWAVLAGKFGMAPTDSGARTEAAEKS